MDEATLDITDFLSLRPQHTPVSVAVEIRTKILQYYLTLPLYHPSPAFIHRLFPSRLHWSLGFCDYLDILYFSIFDFQYFLDPILISYFVLFLFVYLFTMLFRQTGLTCSMGIASTNLLAKVGPSPLSFFVSAYLLFPFYLSY